MLNGTSPKSTPSLRKARLFTGKNVPVGPTAVRPPVAGLTR